jgi:hypothetical protein
MNAKTNHRALRSAAAAALLAIVATPPALAAVDCGAPRGIDQQRACKAAEEGVDSLRRFSERTRNIYQIYVHDYTAAIAPRAGTNDDARIKVAAANE